ncbi:MAG: hypothetical protein J6I64_00380 [Lachnospiraceae bacterium]|nr:hypothetical protein [Lachnospiraceae bacterium]
MFGYIIINKQELKFKEFDLYHSYYCGLCQKLKEKYGKSGQMTLTYDLTFLIMLLTDLYQDESTQDQCRCVAHPLEKHTTRTSRFTDYAADMNLLLSYYKCEDDWNDERKWTKRTASTLLRKKAQDIGANYPAKAAAIEKWLVQLHTYEQNHTGTIDEVAGCFGQIMAEIFVCQRDEWEADLRRMGFYLGKFIYLMDAYEDLEQDEKSGNYNPLLPLWKEPAFEESCRQILTMMLAEACKAFERLPLDDHVSILGNILYSGVWCRYEMINRKRKDQNNHV